jgi:hypothetical protein
MRGNQLWFRFPTFAFLFFSFPFASLRSAHGSGGFDVSKFELSVFVSAKSVNMDIRIRIRF